MTTSKKFWRCASPFCQTKGKIWIGLDHFTQHLEHAHSNESHVDLVRMSSHAPHLGDAYVSRPEQIIQTSNRAQSMRGWWTKCRARERERDEKDVTKNQPLQLAAKSNTAVHNVAQPPLSHGQKREYGHGKRNKFHPDWPMQPMLLDQHNKRGLLMAQPEYDRLGLGYPLVMLQPNEPWPWPTRLKDDGFNQEIDYGGIRPFSWALSDKRDQQGIPQYDDSPPPERTRDIYTPEFVRLGGSDRRSATIMEKGRVPRLQRNTIVEKRHRVPDDDEVDVIEEEDDEHRKRRSRYIERTGHTEEEPRRSLATRHPIISNLHKESKISMKSTISDGCSSEKQYRKRLLICLADRPHSSFGGSKTNRAGHKLGFLALGNGVPRTGLGLQPGTNTRSLHS